MKNLVLFLVSSLVISHATNECLWLTKGSTCGDLDMCASGSCNKDCSTDGGIKPCPQRSRKYITYTYLGCQISQAEENCHQQTFVQDYSSDDKSWKQLIPQEGTNLIRGMKYVSETLVIGWDKQYVFKMDPTAATPQWTIIGRSFTQIRHVGVLAPNHVYVVATEYKMQDKNGRKFSIWHYNADGTDNNKPGKLLRNYWSGIFDKTGVDGVHLMAPMHDERFAILERVVSSDPGQSAETGIVNIFICDVETVDANATGTGTDKEQKTYLHEACTFRAKLTGTFPNDMAYSPDNNSLYIVSFDATGQPARNPEATHKYRNHVQRLSLSGSCRDPQVKCAPKSGGSKSPAECSARIAEIKTKDACSLQDGTADDECVFLAGGDSSTCSQGMNKEECVALRDPRNGQCQWSTDPFCDYDADPANCQPYRGAETIIQNQDDWSDTFYDMGFEVGHKRIYMVGGRVIPSVVNVFDLDGTFLGHEPQYFPFHPCYDYPGQNFVSLATGNSAVPFDEKETTLTYNRPPITEALTKKAETSLECAQIEHEKSGLDGRWEAQGALAFKGMCEQLAQKQSVYLDKECGNLLHPPEFTNKSDTTVTFKKITLEKLNADPEQYRAALAKYLAVGVDRIEFMTAKCVATGWAVECPAFTDTATCAEAKGLAPGSCSWRESSAKPGSDGHPTIIVEYKGTKEENNMFCQNETKRGHDTNENDDSFSTSDCVTSAIDRPTKQASGDGGTVVVVIILFALIGLVAAGGAWWYFNRKDLDADAKYGHVQEQNALNTVESMNAPVESMYDAPANQPTNMSGDDKTSDYATTGQDLDEPIVVTAL